jgi:hypothetical protein
VGVFGCFLSHYYLWKQCSTDNIPYIILEHDGYIIKPFPADVLNQFKDVLNLDGLDPYSKHYENSLKTETDLEILYKKYYKYTALTNNTGDYMIFGVPIGTQTVHLSVDITDIGEFSMNPAAMVVNLGYSANLFMNNGTKIKPSTSLGDLPNVETQEISVDIIPFWGDTENFEIGITRQDFRIRAILTNTFTIFGSAFTDSDQTMRGTEDSSSPNVKEIRDYFWVYPQDNWHGLALATKRIGKIKRNTYATCNRKRRRNFHR